jgi:hypothetical protein
MSFKFEVTNIYDDEVSSSLTLQEKLKLKPKEGGFFLSGLNINGAIWNSKFNFLEDTPHHMPTMV